MCVCVCVYVCVYFVIENPSECHDMYTACWVALVKKLHNTFYVTVLLDHTIGRTFYADAFSTNQKRLWIS